MYKVIYNGIVIDVLKTVRYGKYVPATKRVVATDPSSANCVVASNLKDRYLLKGVPIPDGCDYKVVSLVPISNEEYYSLVEKESSPYLTGIKRLKAAKINELREICDRNILSGVQVQLSDNKFHHFTMSIEDQLNLLEIRHLISIGETELIYHETGGEYKMYSVSDMQKIIDETFKHKQNQLLIFNKLKKYVNELNSIDEICKVKYSVINN